MDASLAMTIAPMGCYSARAGFGSIQRETQGYIHNSVRTVSERERKAILRKVLSSRRDDKATRAAVECYFFRTARVHEWHILTEEQQSAAVSTFISQIYAAAAGIVSAQGQKEVKK